MKDNILEVKNATKEYGNGNNKFYALNDVSMIGREGEFISIIGKSGSGKSTLLNLIGGIDNPTKGEIILNGCNIGCLSGKRLSRLRGENIGFIFQFFQLLPTLNVLENVMIPMQFLRKIPSRNQRERAEMLLSKVGIEDQKFKFPHELSGGQQQRAAIARALANDPKIILADEPTGNLDSKMADTVFNLLQSLADEKKTVIMVTHDEELSKRCSRIIRIQDGKIVKEV